jgi:two-component system sensor histidine kinase KdpD
MPTNPIRARRAAWRRAGPALLVWAAGWLALLLLDGTLDLANLALLLVLVSAVAALWLPGWATVLCSAAVVLAFNWTFVPPRHTFGVDLRQHALLLAAMWLVNALIGTLVAGQRRLALQAQGHAEREARLRTWGDTLRDATDPAAHASALHDALAAAAGVPVALRVLQRLGAAPDDPDDPGALLDVGEADNDQRAGLALCVREGRPLGPGSGRYEEQPDVYLPLRGRGATLGAAVLRGLGDGGRDRTLRDHAQALCDLLGQALQRSQVAELERRTREHAQDQAVRNTLLAAISHDYRTPLATIMGAASALAEQGDRLAFEQRRKLAAGIVEETERLSRLTDNTLQLARLDAPGVALRCDWESAEEIVGAVLRRVRRRDEGQRTRARLEPGLPLLWCDAMLVSQLLENLVDNALKYSPAEAPVEILVRRIGEHALLAVRDRGPGIAPAWRERVFDVFRRGSGSPALEREVARRGAGVGLAVCRAIARAHGGEMRVRPRAHGGSAFEFLLPLRDAPEAPTENPAG